MNAKVLGALAAVLAVGGLVSLALRSQKTLEKGLPPRTVCASPEAAVEAAVGYIVAHGGSVSPVLGTGSMSPYIPEAAPGLDPRRTIVAFAVSERGTGFNDVKAGNLLIYEPEFTSGLYIHGAAEKDGDGWVMSGLANKRSESGHRVTQKNFVAIVAHVFTWAQREEL